MLKAEQVPAALARGTPTERPATAPARFAVGAGVRTRAESVDHHTRLPGYVRGKRGTHRARARHARLCRRACAGPGRIAAMAATRWCSTAASSGETQSRSRRRRRVGRCVGSLSARGHMSGSVRCVSRHAARRRWPVFREPWEAQAFAMAWRCTSGGLFTWVEWADALPRQIVSHRRPAIRTPGTPTTATGSPRSKALVAAKVPARAEELATLAGRPGNTRRSHATRQADRTARSRFRLKPGTFSRHWAHAARPVIFRPAAPAPDS